MNIKLDEATTKAIEKYAAKRNITSEEAAAKLVTVASNRLRATDRYAAKQRGEKPTPKKAAPKAKAPKVVKAKGPLARKTAPAKKAAPKAPKTTIPVVNAEPAAPVVEG